MGTDAVVPYHAVGPRCSEAPFHPAAPQRIRGGPRWEVRDLHLVPRCRLGTSPADRIWMGTDAVVPYHVV